MKRRSFIHGVGLMALTTLTGCKADDGSKKPEKEIYELRIYELSDKKDLLISFLRNTYIPAMNRLGAKVGVYNSYKNEEDSRLWVLSAYSDMEAYRDASERIWEDQTFRSAAQAYFDATSKGSAFKDCQTFLMESLSEKMTFTDPKKEHALKEIRIYHSPNMDGHRRKVEMFTEDEHKVFEEQEMDVAFYGKVLAGPTTPSIIYMLSFEDEEVRDRKWKAFSPAFRPLASQEKYQNCMDRVVSNDYVRSLDFSQI